MSTTRIGSFNVENMFARPKVMGRNATKHAAPVLAAHARFNELIAAVTDEFIGRLVMDPALAKFFSGHGTDSKQRIRQHVIDLLCMATGGPCVYKGRDMKTTHAGLGISEADWKTLRSIQPEPVDWLKGKIRETIEQARGSAAPGTPRTSAAASGNAH